MAALKALLQIQADVTGESKVTALGGAIAGVGRTATAVTGSLRGLTAAAGMSGLAGSMTALAPLLSVAGLVGMAKSSLDAGTAMFDLSQKTGVSVEMLAKFKKAASVSGTTMESVSGALVKLSKAMSMSLNSAADSAGKSAEIIQQKAKESVQRSIDVVRSGADRQIAAVKDGERRQLDAVKTAADKRIEAIERESDRRLNELNRRYRQEEKILNDNYDDESDRRQEAADEAQRIEERRIEDHYDARREQIQNDERLGKQQQEAMLRNLQDQQEDEMVTLRRGYESRRKQESRLLRDLQEVEAQALQDRKSKEETAIKASADKQKNIIEKGAEQQKQSITAAADASAAAIKQSADASIKSLEATLEKADPLSEAMEDMGLNGKAASKAFQELGINLRNADGSMKSADRVMLDIANKFKEMPDGVEKTSLAMKLFGRSGAEMIPMLNKGGDAIESIKVKMTEAFAKKAKEHSVSLTILSGKVGALGMDIMILLLPTLDTLANILTVVVSAFNDLPGPIRNLAVLGSVLAIAWGPISGIFAGLAALKIGATIAGWSALALPAVTAIKAAFAGLLAWLTGTMLPGLIAFFSGPVGWTVLAVAAVVAMAIAFREPIGKFFSWLGEILPQVLKTLLDLAYEVWVQPWVDIWNNVLKEPISDFLAWLPGSLDKGLKAALALAYDVWVKPWVDLWNNVLRKPISDMMSWMGNAIRAPFEAAANFIKGIFNGIIQTIGNGINAAAGAINRLIGAYNSLPTPDLPLVPTIAIPQFAEGGVVSRPTLAMVGEGGEREYIIPESKMAAASARYLSGGRGDAVLSGGAGNAIINIRTGPVMQSDGQQFVTLSDLERAVRQTEAGVMARLRTPAARRALGIR